MRGGGSARGMRTLCGSRMGLGPTLCGSRLGLGPTLCGFCFCCAAGVVEVTTVVLEGMWSSTVLPRGSEEATLMSRDESEGPPDGPSWECYWPRDPWMGQVDPTSGYWGSASTFPPPPRRRVTGNWFLFLITILWYFFILFLLGFVIFLLP